MTVPTKKKTGSEFIISCLKYPMRQRQSQLQPRESSGLPSLGVHHLRLPQSLAHFREQMRSPDP